MKSLNEREKKMRGIAMMNLNVGSKTEKEAAKRFLKDIGLSDDAIENIENKGKKKEKVEESSLNEECDCEKCDKEKHSKCNKPSKKCKKHDNKADMMGEEEIRDKINTVGSAQELLRAKKINFDKTEKIGNKTVFKQGTTIVGTWDPSWGTVRTGEDLMKEDESSWKTYIGKVVGVEDFEQLSGKRGKLISVSGNNGIVDIVGVGKKSIPLTHLVYITTGEPTIKSGM